jgi:hypothetical protein
MPVAGLIKTGAKRRKIVWVLIQRVFQRLLTSKLRWKGLDLLFQLTILTYGVKAREHSGKLLSVECRVNQFFAPIFEPWVHVTYLNCSGMLVMSSSNS